MASVALLLVNLGGPPDLDGVRPFLEAIFSDPAILPVPAWLRPTLARSLARRRAKVVSRRYRLVGGGSPLGALTERQVEAVRRSLGARGAEADVGHAFRYSAPTIEQALGALAERGARQVRLLPLFPHRSLALGGSVEREARRAAALRGLDLLVLRAWGADPAAVALWADRARARLAAMAPGARVLFVAHGIPLRDVRRGDDYPERVAETARAVAAALPAGTPWSLAYQSRVGPLGWTRPYLGDEVSRLARTPPPVLLVPLSFAADCLETLYDLDHEAAARLRIRGVEQVERLATFDDDPAFADLLARLAFA
jgi:ferrochelatase